MIRVKHDDLQKIKELLADSLNPHIKVCGSIDENIVFTLDDSNDLLDRSYGGYQNGVPTPITKLYFMYTGNDILFIGLEKDIIKDKPVYNILPMRVGKDINIVKYINEALENYKVEVEMYNPKS